MHEAGTTTKSLLIRYLGPQRVRVALLALLLFTSTGLPLAGPQLLRRFIDTAKAGGALGTLTRIAVVYLSVAVATQVISVATTYVSELVGWSSTNELRGDLADHALGLDMAFHNTHTPGEMIERVDGDVTALSNFFSQFVLSVLGSGLMMIGILVLTYREDVRVGLALTVFTAIVLVVLHRLRRIAVPHATAQRESSAGLFGFIEERLAGLDDIRANGAGPHVMRSFAVARRELFRAFMSQERVSGTIWSSSGVMFAAGYALTLGLGAWLYRGGAITLGTVYLLFQYMVMLRRPLEVISHQLRDFQKAGAGIVRVQELFGISSAVTGGSGRLRPSGPLAVSFEDVSFGYGGPDPVLRDVSFALEPGEVLGVLGRTGSGKTTIARLLLRLYDPASGRVVLGGHDVRDLDLADLRHRAGMVTQEVQLFQATVRDNLTLFSEDARDERMIEVLSDLGLLDWYTSLGDGLDTEIGGTDTGLSAGEAQLLAFARLFLRDPGLVILDEASSRLDPATESLIERAVDRLLERRTGIVIAHRLATVRRADRILILADGRIVEHGVRAELEADPESRFSQLLRTGIEEVLA